MSISNNERKTHAGFAESVSRDLIRGTLPGIGRLGAKVVVGLALGWKLPNGHSEQDIDEFIAEALSTPSWLGRLATYAVAQDTPSTHRTYTDRTISGVGYVPGALGALVGVLARLTYKGAGRLVRSGKSPIKV